LTITNTLLTLLCVVLLSAGQLLFKMVATSLSRAPIDSFVIGLFGNPWFLVALVLYGTATLIWLAVLRSTPLSQAYTLFALSFVLVPLCAMVWFQEPLGWRQVAGAMLIIAGIVVSTGAKN
jgi:drug/metabolite transporter (DMT)-like permease